MELVNRLIRRGLMVFKAIVKDTSYFSNEFFELIGAFN